jgi:hypothetical protein
LTRSQIDRDRDGLQDRSQLARIDLVAEAPDAAASNKRSHGNLLFAYRDVGVLARGFQMGGNRVTSETYSLHAATTAIADLIDQHPNVGIASSATRAPASAARYPASGSVSASRAAPLRVFVRS